MREMRMQGYNEMIRKVKPKAIICYGEPFKEMQGKIIHIDYAKTNNLNQKDAKDIFYIKKTVDTYVVKKVVAENENIPETTLQNHLKKILNGVGKATHQQEKVHAQERESQVLYARGLLCTLKQELR